MLSKSPGPSVYFRLATFSNPGARRGRIDGGDCRNRKATNQILFCLFLRSSNDSSPATYIPRLNGLRGGGVGGGKAVLLIEKHSLNFDAARSSIKALGSRSSRSKSQKQQPPKQTPYQLLPSTYIDTTADGASPAYCAVSRGSSSFRW